MSVETVLFDMDGLLLDTERIYSQVTSAIVARYGKTYDWAIKAKLMGKTSMDAAKLLVDELQLPMSPQEYLDEREEGHRLLFPHCKPLPGVVQTVSHLKKHSIPIAVATSSHRAAFDLKTQNNQDLFCLFDAVITGDDYRVKKGKPAPDIFLEAAKLLEQPEPTKCLVFEDSPSGVQAGLNAGMHVIWIPDAELEIDHLLAKQCRQVLKSMTEFDPRLYGLPGL